MNHNIHADGIVDFRSASMEARLLAAFRDLDLNNKRMIVEMAEAFRKIQNNASRGDPNQ